MEDNRQKNTVLGILAHVDAGKTTLSEDLLYHFNMIRSIGRVDDKNTFLDTDSVEKERGITIYAKQAILESRHGRITLLDTPGHVDFSGEMQRTLSVLDGCLFVINGADGIDAHTARLWEILSENDIPVLIFVNKMDQFGMRGTSADQSDISLERDTSETLDIGKQSAPSDDTNLEYDRKQLQNRKTEILREMKLHFGEGCIEFSEEDLSGIREGFGSSDFFEAAASEEEDAMNRFLEEGGLSVETVRTLWKQRKIFPVVFGSALKRHSVEEIALLTEEFPESRDEERISDLLEEFSEEDYAEITRVCNSISSNRDDTNSRATGIAEHAGDVSDSDETGIDVFESKEMTTLSLRAAGRIFKITRDSRGNRLTHLKLFTGTLKVREEFASHGKINQIQILSGNRSEPVTEAGRGEIITLMGPVGTYAGEGFVCTSDGKWYLSSESGRAPFEPVLRYRVIPPEGCDIGHELLPKLRILEEEEPLLSVEDNSDHGEVLVSVMGQVQMEILQRQMMDRFGLVVTFSEGTILYKETITGVAEGVGHFEPLRHYAEAHLLLEPLPAGSGLEFDTDVSTDLLATNWQRLILTHLKERPIRGVLTGTPMTDLRITVVGGKAHPKHTEGGDFRQATYRAIRQGLMQLLSRGEVELLEPYERFVIRVPSDLVGRIMTDFDRLDPPRIDYETGRAELSGIAPTAKLQTYFKDLTAFSKGEGSIERDYIGYGPCHNPEEVILARDYHPENDLRYTADSVFCAGGSGYTVPWNEVFSYMHAPLSEIFLDMIQKPGAIGALGSEGAAGSGIDGASGTAGPIGENGAASFSSDEAGNFVSGNPGSNSIAGRNGITGSNSNTGGSNAGRRGGSGGSSGNDGPYLGTEEIDRIISQTFYANSSRDGKDVKRGGSTRGRIRKAWGGSRRYDSGAGYGAQESSGSGSGSSGSVTVGSESAESGTSKNGVVKNGATGNGSGRSGKNHGKKEEKQRVLLVDGYNVVFSWNDLKELAAVNIDSARDSLIGRLGTYHAWDPDTELILVFDAYRVRGGAGSEQMLHGIRVVYTEQDETADRFIERYAHDHRDRAVITVVTSDRLEQITIRSQGCYLMGSHEFERIVEECNRRGMEDYEALKERNERAEREAERKNNKEEQ